MKAKIKVSDLKRLVERTKKFISTNGGYKLMEYIYLEVNAETMEVKAMSTDGRRISVEYAGIMEADESFECCIKPNIPKIRKDDEYVELELSHGKAYLTVGENITGYIQPNRYYSSLKTNIENSIEGFKEVTVKASIGVNIKLLKEILASMEKSSRTFAKIEIAESNQPIRITFADKEEERNVKFLFPARLGE